MFVFFTTCFPFFSRTISFALHLRLLSIPCMLTFDLMSRKSKGKGSLLTGLELVTIFEAATEEWCGRYLNSGDDAQVSHSRTISTTTVPFSFSFSLPLLSSATFCCLGFCSLRVRGLGFTLYYCKIMSAKIYVGSVRARIRDLSFVLQTRYFPFPVLRNGEGDVSFADSHPFL